MDLTHLFLRERQTETGSKRHHRVRVKPPEKENRVLRFLSLNKGASKAPRGQPSRGPA